MLVKFQGWKFSNGIRLTPMDLPGYNRKGPKYHTSNTLKKGSLGIVLEEHHWHPDESNKRWLIYWQETHEKIWTYESEMKLAKKSFLGKLFSRSFGSGASGGDPGP